MRKRVIYVSTAIRGPLRRPRCEPCESQHGCCYRSRSIPHPILFSFLPLSLLIRDRLAHGNPAFFNANELCISTIVDKRTNQNVKNIKITTTTTTTASKNNNKTKNSKKHRLYHSRLFYVLKFYQTALRSSDPMAIKDPLAYRKSLFF